VDFFAKFTDFKKNILIFLIFFLAQNFIFASCSVASPLILNARSSTVSKIAAYYSQTNTAGGGTGSYTYSVSAGSIPAGLSLNSSIGKVFGTPTQAGSFSYTIQVNDGSATQAQIISGTILPPTITISPTTDNLAGGVKGTNYSANVTASGGTAPFSYAVSAGSLPAGLSLNANSGAITGTPTTSGTSNFTILATDYSTGTSAPFSQSRSYSLTISNPALLLNSVLSESTQVGVSYYQTNSASGGSGSYSYSISGGSFPSGLTFSTTTGTIGIVSGTPTQAGAFSYIIQVNDGLVSTSQTISGTIIPAPISFITTELPKGKEKNDYSKIIEVSGGTGPYKYSVSSGLLPDGLNIDSDTGEISGSPTNPAIYDFTIQVTDHNSIIATKNYSIIIHSAVAASNAAIAISGNTTHQIIDLSSYVANGDEEETMAINIISNPSHGTALIDGKIVTYTPNHNYFGTDQFTYSANVATSKSKSLKSSGDFAMAIVDIAINDDRPNPANDPNVTGLLATQIASSYRFMDAQISNITNHLENLHHNSFVSNLHFNKECSFSRSKDPQVKNSNHRNCDAQSGVVNALSQYLASKLTDSDQSKINQFEQLNFSTWAAGTVNFGSLSEITSNHFTTSGLTFGIDTRLGPTGIIGISTGFGFDDSTIGHDKTSSNNSNYNGTLYASYQLFKSVFIDGLIGYGKSYFNTRRFVAIDNIYVGGTRHGNQFFGSIGIKGEIPDGNFRLMPYLRVDALHANLNSYSEQGDETWNLKYNQLTINSLTTAGGFRGFYDFTTKWGILSPSLRLEYRSLKNQNQAQILNYTNGKKIFTIPKTNTNSSNKIFAIALHAQTNYNLLSDIEYGASAAEQKITAILSFKF
jgi:hypothetical protein